MENHSKSKQNRRNMRNVQKLGEELLSSIAYIGNAKHLLKYISPEYPPQIILESLISLQSFFTPLLPSLTPSKINKSKDEADVKSKKWLRKRFDELIMQLINVILVNDVDDTLKEFVLDSVMEFVKIGNGGKFSSVIYHKLLDNLVNSSMPVDNVLELLISKYFTYIDVRYFTYISIEKLAKPDETKVDPDGKVKNADGDDVNHSRTSMDLCIRKIHRILMGIPALEEPKENSAFEAWSSSGLLLKEGETEDAPEVSNMQDKHHNNALSVTKIRKKMKLKFTNSWISFLRLPLPVDVYKEVLSSLSKAVIPYISNPLMLCDFLTRSYDIGGVVSVMALDGLFILMTRYQLQYPNFYDKLYALLVPSIFMAKHRARFFQLLDACLKSDLVPAYMAAAFAKKLSRLALAVPPSGGVVIIALIHNVLRKHPSINFLVHREDGNENAPENSEANGDSTGIVKNSTDKSDAANTKSGIDHFNNEESNPIKSRALRSSLWEIDTLRHHYCPPVSRFVLSLENDLTVRKETTEVNIKDFSSSSYKTIFEEELRRRVKQVPLAFFKATPSSLFSESDFPGWTFKYEETKQNDSVDGIANKPEENDCSPAKRQRVECS